MVLNRISGSHHKAYIPGRFISEATKNTYDIFEHATRTKNPGLAVLIGFEKAFDSVSFEFFQKILKIFGFGENFRIWINIIGGIQMKMLNSLESALSMAIQPINSKYLEAMGKVTQLQATYLFYVLIYSPSLFRTQRQSLMQQNKETQN